MSSAQVWLHCALLLLLLLLCCAGLHPNGFSFEGTDAAGLDYALNRALSMYYSDRQHWNDLAADVMQQDWSWDGPGRVSPGLFVATADTQHAAIAESLQPCCQQHVIGTCTLLMQCHPSLLHSCPSHPVTPSQPWTTWSSTTRHSREATERSETRVCVCVGVGLGSE